MTVAFFEFIVGLVILGLCTLLLTVCVIAALTIPEPLPIVVMAAAGFGFGCYGYDLAFKGFAALVTTP